MQTYSTVTQKKTKNTNAEVGKKQPLLQLNPQTKNADTLSTALKAAQPAILRQSY